MNGFVSELVVSPDVALIEFHGHDREQHIMRAFPDAIRQETLIQFSEKDEEAVDSLVSDMSRLDFTCRRRVFWFVSECVRAAVEHAMSNQPCRIVFDLEAYQYGGSAQCIIIIDSDPPLFTGL